MIKNLTGRAADVTGAASRIDRSDGRIADAWADKLRPDIQNRNNEEGNA